MATGSPQTTVEVFKDLPARVGNFGCNGKEPQTAVAAPAVATDLATALTLVNGIRTALIACGILV